MSKSPIHAIHRMSERYADGIPLEEIADAYGIRSGSVEQLLEEWLAPDTYRMVGSKRKLELERARRRARNTSVWDYVPFGEGRETKIRRRREKWTPENPTVHKLLEAYLDGQILRRVGKDLEVNNPSGALTSAYGKETMSSFRQIRYIAKRGSSGAPRAFWSAMESLLGRVPSDASTPDTPPAGDDE